MTKTISTITVSFKWRQRAVTIFLDVEKFHDPVYLQITFIIFTFQEES
jgi:hypothetical protein